MAISLERAALILTLATFLIFEGNYSLACDNVDNKHDCSKSVFHPTDEQCKKVGGYVNEAGQCETKVTMEECDKMGGTYDPIIGCYKEPSKEECTIFGGAIDNNGECALEENNGQHQ